MARKSALGESVWQSKERLLRVTRAINEGMWDWDFPRNKLHYSSKWFEMLGYTPAELDPTPELWQRLVHPQDFAAVNKTFQTALEDGSENYEVEFRLKHKSGRYVPVLSRGFITRDRKGKPLRVSGTNVDLTTRKKEEAHLRKTSAKLAKSEGKFRKFFEQSPIPLCHLQVDRDATSKRLLLINQAFLDFFGYSHAEIATMDQWLEKGCANPEYRQQCAALWNQDVAEAVRNSGSIRDREYRIRCKDGRDVIVLIGGIFLGEALLVTFTDLTETKKAEAEMAQRESELRTILNHVPLPLSYSTQETYPLLRFNNVEFTRCFGYTLKEIPNVEEWARLVYPDEVYREESMSRWHREIRLATAGNGVVPPLEFRVRRKDGEYRDVIISAFLAGDMILTSFVDITDGKKAEEKLRQARLREKLLKEKQVLTLQKKLQTSVVAAAVAHEINQPLSQILLKTRLALESLPASGKKHGHLSDLLQGIVSDSVKVKSTIEKMRALLRNVPTTLKPVHLRDVIDSSLLYLKPRLKQSAVAVETSTQGTPRPIAGDAQQLQLAFSNLIRNALDAVSNMPLGGRKIRIQLIQRTTAIELVIGDSGPGISPEIKAEIFDLLTSDKPQGTGIGLYLVRTAMINHGGTVRHGFSDLGGVEFCLSFPSPRTTRTTP